MKAHYCKHLFLQGLAAIVFMWAVLFSLDHATVSQIMWAVGASTLASSTFIVFCSPENTVAIPWKILGAYILAMLLGEAMRGLANVLCGMFPHCIPGHPFHYIFEVVGAFTVGIALVLMALTKLEHPPAAGLAVVMMLDIRNMPVLGVILAAAVALVLIRIIFRHKLCNLM